MSGYRVYSNELKHHGIQGMKWGIRRYQNPDGSLTQLGKERYRGTSGVKTHAEEVLKNAYSPESDTAYGRSKRATDAAKLGLKTLQRMNHIRTGNLNPEDKGSREWFLFEDQTIGMAVIADLINSGYSSAQCEQLIESANNMDYNNRPAAAFELVNGYGLEEFARECEKVYNMEHK